MISKKIFCCYLDSCSVRCEFSISADEKIDSMLCQETSPNTEEQISWIQSKNDAVLLSHTMVVDGLTTNENGMASLSFKPTKWWKTETSIYFRFVQNYRFRQNTTTTAAAIRAAKTTKTMKKYFIVRLCASWAVAVFIQFRTQAFKNYQWEFEINSAKKLFALRIFYNLKTYIREWDTSTYIVREWLRGEEKERVRVSECVINLLYRNDAMSAVAPSTNDRNVCSDVQQNN